MQQDWDKLGRLLGFSCEKDMLTSLYVRDNMSLGQIAERLNCGTATIANRLEKYAIPKRGKGGANNVAHFQKRLFHLDQRIVLKHELKAVALLSGVSRSLCYKFRRMVLGGPNAVRDNQSGSGTEPVFDSF